MSKADAAALLVASRRRELLAVISIAAFAHPAELMRRQMRSHHIPYFPFGWLVLRFIERTIKADFDDIAPCNRIRQVTCPVLLVHGEEDERVPSADALRIYANSRKGRTDLLILSKTGHDSRDAISTHGDSLLTFLQQSVVGASGPGKGGSRHNVVSAGGLPCPEPNTDVSAMFPRISVTDGISDACKGAVRLRPGASG